MADGKVMDMSQFKELLDDMDVLSRTEQRKVMNVATRRGAVVLAQAVRKAAPKKTGNLRRNIVALNLRKKSDQTGAAAVFIRTEGKANSGKNAFYWYFLEKGTSSRAGQPFIGPAYEANKAAVDEIILDVAEKQLNRVLKLK